jgi:hypothetical protein
MMSIGKKKLNWRQKNNKKRKKSVLKKKRNKLN